MVPCGTLVRRTSWVRAGPPSRSGACACLSRLCCSQTSVQPVSCAAATLAARYVREQQVDYVPLMENSSDPAHVHFTHAGYIGARDRAGPLAVRLVQQVGVAGQGRGAASWVGRHCGVMWCPALQ